MEPLALKLVILKGPREGETLEFRPGSNVRIGRLVRGNTLPIKDSGISSKHLSIESESGIWVLRDLDSSNGTIVNDTKVPPNKPWDLSDGDEIKIGEYTKIAVKIHGGSEESRLRRNPRRGAAAAAATGGSVAENRGRRGRVEAAKESEVKFELEGENGEESEAIGKRRRGRPRKARVLKSDEPVEQNPVPQLSTRQTRSSKNEECVVADSELGKIKGKSGIEGGEVKIGPRKTRGGRRKKNGPEELPECDKVDVLEQRGLGDRVVIDVEDNECAKGLNLEEENRGEGGGELNVRESGEKGLNLEEKSHEEMASELNVRESGEKGLNLEEESHEEAASEANVRESDDKGENGSRSGSGSGVKESLEKGGQVSDLDKMTMGQWFDYLEIYLPKQIIDATDEMMAAMAEKAERVRKYVIEQKKVKGQLG